MTDTQIAYGYVIFIGVMLAVANFAVSLLPV